MAKIVMGYQGTEAFGDGEIAEFGNVGFGDASGFRNFVAVVIGVAAGTWLAKRVKARTPALAVAAIVGGVIGYKIGGVA